MEASFYSGNRRVFMEHMKEGELAVFLSGEIIRKSADDDHPFYANRNFRSEEHTSELQSH